jgi:hypothetical protein
MRLRDVLAEELLVEQHMQHRENGGDTRTEPNVAGSVVAKIFVLPGSGRPVNCCANEKA